jgi:hypothetical protein
MRATLSILSLVLFGLFTGATARAEEITPAGKKLAELLDGMKVEELWLQGETVQWKTGVTIKAATDGKAHTHCSAFVAAVALKKDVYILRPPEHSTVLLANAQCDWLKEDGKKQGWKSVDTAVEAQALAKEGGVKYYVHDLKWEK